MPPPGVPGPFSLDDPEILATLLSDAGLSDVEVGRLSTPQRGGSFEEWWATTPALAGPLAKVLGSVPEAAADVLRARLRVATSAYATPGGLELPGVSLVVGARRGPA